MVIEGKYSEKGQITILQDDGTYVNQPNIETVTITKLRDKTYKVEARLPGFDCVIITFEENGVLKGVNTFPSYHEFKFTKKCCTHKYVVYNQEKKYYASSINRLTKIE
jgi:hypothetical protein